MKAGAVIKPHGTIRVDGLPQGATVILVGKVDGKTTTAGGFHRVSDSSEGAWRSSPLPPAGEWTISVPEPGGGTRSIKFSTSEPEVVDTPYLYPQSGTYGVGMPIMVHFDGPVTNRGAVEKALSVATSKDIGDAAWSWLDADTVGFLPDDYWPANTEVRVAVNLDGVELSEGVWGADVSGDFLIGRELIMKMDLSEHRMRVIEDGEVLRTLPVSGGKPGWETASGIKVVSEMFDVKRLQNSSGPETWDVTVPWAMRLTYTGEFIHSAPWNGDIGYANTSHGCTNLTTSDAEWLYSKVLVGDVVETTGSGVRVETWNGLGGIWNQDWESWTAGSYAGEPSHRSASAPPVSAMDFPG